MKGGFNSSQANRALKKSKDKGERHFANQSDEMPCSTVRLAFAVIHLGIEQSIGSRVRVGPQLNRPLLTPNYGLGKNGNPPLDFTNAP